MLQLVSHIASSVVNLTALACPIFSIERFGRATPISFESWVKVISLLLCFIKCLSMPHGKINEFKVFGFIKFFQPGK